MMKAIVTVIVTYLATSFDEIPVLFLMYSKAKKKGEGKYITIGYFVGTFLLVGIGLLGAYGLLLIPSQWVVGLIGLIPLILGIKTLIKGEEEEQVESITSRFRFLGLQMLMITFAFGADDLGVYIPLFTTFRGSDIIRMLFVFAVGTGMLCIISYRLVRIDRLVAFVEQKERYVVGIVFVLIGIYVLLECGTLAYLIGLFHI